MEKSLAGLSTAEWQALRSELLAADGPGGSRWVGEGSATQRVNEVVVASLRANDGKLPGENERWPFLVLTAKGARSGKQRTVPLAALTIEGRLLIVASMSGARRNPPWFHNLVANPEVLVEYRGETFRAHAELIDPPERDRLFATIAELRPEFGEYQARTKRSLPVFELIRPSDSV